MPRNPNSQNKLSMKTRLILIAIMFVIINLVFYVGFDSSDESSDESNLNDQIQSDLDNSENLEITISDSISP